MVHFLLPVKLIGEVFLEVSVPVISGLNFAEEVGISAGYRYSDYTTKSSNWFVFDTWFRII